MDTAASGHPKAMRMTNPGADGMTGRVRVQDAKPGMRILWGGRPVTLTDVLRRNATQFVVRAEGGLECEMGALAVLKLVPKAPATV